MFGGYQASFFSHWQDAAGQWVSPVGLWPERDRRMRKLQKFLGIAAYRERPELHVGRLAGARMTG